MKNYILNGAMRFDQNQEGAIYYSDPNSETYTLDQWRFCGGTSGVGRFSVQRMPVDFKGFDFCLQAASTVQQTTLNATDNMHIEYPIEGSRMGSWAFGTGDAKTITASFWFISTIAGEFSFSLMNGINTRSYVTSFTIDTGSVPQFITITIPGDIAGTWTSAECTFGAKFLWTLGVGSTASTSTTEEWQGAAYWNKSGSTQLIEYTANTSIYIMGFQVELGDTATDFEFRDLTEELLDLQRYYYKTFPQGIPVGYGKGTSGSINYVAQNAGVSIEGVEVYLPVKMCAPNAPVTLYNPFTSCDNWYNQSLSSVSGEPTIYNQSEDKLYLSNCQVSGDTKGSLLNVHMVINSRLGGS